MAGIYTIHNLDTSLLARPVEDGEGVPTTPLSLLRGAGMTRENIVEILNRPGGLGSLKALLKPMVDAHGQSLLYAGGNPKTRLSVLIEAGFTIKNIVDVFNVDVLDHGGSVNLAALLKPMVDARNRLLTDMRGYPFLDVHGQPTTPLSIFINAGFAIENIIAVVSHAGGANNIRALSDLLNNPDINLYVKSNAEIVTIICSLANGDLESDLRIYLLGEILGQAELREDLIKNPEKLQFLVDAINRLESKEKIKRREITSVAEMNLFCACGVPKLFAHKRLAEVGEEPGAAEEEPRAKRARWEKPRAKMPVDALTFFVAPSPSNPTLDEILHSASST